jgi:hypothetical protein
MAKNNEKTIEIEANRPTDFVIAYWYDKPQDMPESEQEHVKEMLEQGYVEGELNDANENRGWWRIVSQQKAR